MKEVLISDLFNEFSEVQEALEDAVNLQGGGDEGEAGTAAYITVGKILNLLAQGNAILILQNPIEFATELRQVAEENRIDPQQSAILYELANYFEKP